MPRPQKPRAGFMASSKGGGGSSKQRKLGDYKLNSDFDKEPGDVDFRYRSDPNELVTRKYLDDRGFWDKFIGAENTAENLNLNRTINQDENEAGLSRDKALLDYTKSLEEQIRQAKNNEEGLLTSAAYDSLVTGRKPGLASELSPIGSQPESVDIPTPYNNAYRGQILGKMPQVALGQQTLATSQLGQQQATQQMGREATPEFQAAKKQNEIGMLLKALDRVAGAGQTIFGGDDNIYAGMGEEQQIIPGPVRNVGGMQFPGEPTKITRQTPGRKIMSEKQILSELGVGGSEEITDYPLESAPILSPRISDDAPAGMLEGQEGQGQEMGYLEKILKMIIRRRYGTNR